MPVEGGFKEVHKYPDKELTGIYLGSTHTMIINNHGGLPVPGDAASTLQDAPTTTQESK